MSASKDGLRLTESDAWRIGRLDAHGQAELLHTAEVSALDLAEAAIMRIKQLEPRLNALSVEAFEAAKERAATLGTPSGMCGVPYFLKDGLDYPGMPTRSGSRSKSDNRSVSVIHEYARRLDAAGLIALGKSNAPEFGLLPSTESLLYGPARNPWALEHSPGGSSGGAAVAVAAGMVALAHAADGGGSIRIPASCCGVFGLKPGRGANVRARDAHFIEDLLVVDVLLSRSVRDVAWAFALTDPQARPMIRPDVASRRLRIAVSQRSLLEALPHPEVADATARTADLCSHLGHHVKEVPLLIDGPAISDSFKVIWGYVASGIRDLVRAEHPSAKLETLLEPWTLGLAEWGQNLAPERLERALEQMVRASAQMRDFFQTYDVILSPVVPTPPPRIGSLGPTQPFARLLPDMFDYVSYTPLHNLAGTPAMSVPLFTSPGGLPIGSMFAAARGGEDVLLTLAYELERTLPWADRWPPISGAG